MEILPGNQPLWYLISLIPNQWEVGYNGAYALKMLVYLEMADRLGISTGPSFFEKLRRYEMEALRIIAGKKGKSGGCDEKQKEKCRFEFGEFFEWACKNCEDAIKTDGQ